MISQKNLIRFAKKWHKVASSPQTASSNMDETPCSSSPRAEKGHFNVYTFDKRRFMIPLAYLKNDTFTKLLEVAEEEFGLPRDGPITLTCDATFMEHVLSTIQTRVVKDLHKAETLHLSSGHSSLPSFVLGEQGHTSPASICSF